MSPHVANVIFDMATEEELFSTFFALVSTLLEKDALFYRPRGGSSWKKVPRFGKEREIIIEVCHALPGGIQL